MFQKIVQKLNFQENHRTMTQYENSLIAKSYSFQFVNSFVTCFYIAFFKSFFEKDCTSSQCIMNDLQTQLFYIYIVALAKNLVELLIPWLKYQVKSRKLAKTVMQQFDNEDYGEQKFSQLQKFLDHQFTLPEYKNLGVDGTFGDYLELCIQFGFLTLFSVAFPLAAVLAAINNIAEMYTDRTKILKMVRRPQPQGAKDIGEWLIILEVTALLCLFSNAGLICFSIHTFKVFGLGNNPVFVFVVLVIILIFVRWTIKIIIPDQPEVYKDLEKRHAFIKNNVFKRQGEKKKDEEKMEQLDLKVLCTC